MANVSSTATVDLIINGQSAQKQLADLKKRMGEAKKEIDNLRKANKENTEEFKKKEKEVDRLNHEFSQMTGAVRSFESVMNNLDKVSLKELEKTLRQMRKELRGMKQDSPDWDNQVSQIQRVQGRINSIRQTLKAQETGTQTFFRRIKEWQTALVGVCQVVWSQLTGIVSYAREAADAFIAMDQEMANVRKYTGMSEEQVESLNEAFRKLDTRSSREQLNQLAQEAGRLGKTSQEDVLGFVKAADKINVALDDLGDGATLTLSKLTGIFGDEQRLGTEKALLSVGSVINELSQNCSASAPYLAEFASRMGGVGAQAGMTVQQIMAFGAVLDTNNMNVEAASTALQQLVVHLY